MRAPGPPRSRPAPRAQPFEQGHGGPGAAARGVAALLRLRPRRHLPQLALHRGLRLHARAGERGAGAAGPGRRERSGAGRALTASPVPADGGGGLRAQPQREQPRRGAVLLLPQGAGGLGARRRPPVSIGGSLGRCPGPGEPLMGAAASSFIFSFFSPLFREEHKKHTAACGFLSLQKDPPNLTVQEFLKLEKMRTRKALVRTQHFVFVQLASFLTTRLCAKCFVASRLGLDQPFPGSQPCFMQDVSCFLLEAERYST